MCAFSPHFTPGPPADPRRAARPVARRLCAHPARARVQPGPPAAGGPVYCCCGVVRCVCPLNVAHGFDVVRILREPEYNLVRQQQVRVPLCAERWECSITCAPSMCASLILHPREPEYNLVCQQQVRFALCANRSMPLFVAHVVGLALKTLTHSRTDAAGCRGRRACVHGRRCPGDCCRGRGAQHAGVCWLANCIVLFRSPWSARLIHSERGGDC